MSKDRLTPNMHQIENDEINLKELCSALWQEKLIIISVTALFAVLAITYALLAKQTWTTTAIISEPLQSDFPEYYNVISDFRPLFEGGSQSTLDILNTYTSPTTIYHLYLQQFYQQENKKEYISSFPAFQETFLTLSSELNSHEKDILKRKLLSDWYEKLSGTTNKDESFTITGIQNNPIDSLNFLTGYLSFSALKAKEVTIENLNSAIEGRHRELIQQKKLMSNEAERRLYSDLKSAEYALEIARAAEINSPQENLGSLGREGQFAINIGGNALDAKVKVLRNLTELEVIKPALQAVNAKLDLFRSLDPNQDIEFKTFRYVEAPEEPLSRTSPKRLLIAILGVLLGGIMGCAIVLTRFAFRKEPIT
ncbi:Wzz/FepE/Etk N-terminal domain-containing protein [Marinomonas sp.]|nr:Wzz/FepE/Etk N-terminal domain-containing protein [Marinomonas sp.]MDB4837330.1 Wzz/FepE/Etk N-terminal domain-containing protein [Marinomonas sp.]